MTQKLAPPTNALLSREMLEKLNRDVGARVVTQLEKYNYVPPQLIAVNIDQTGGPTLLMHIEPLMAVAAASDVVTSAHIASFARLSLDPDSTTSKTIAAALGAFPNVFMHISEAQFVPQRENTPYEVLVIAIHSDRGMTPSTSIITTDDAGVRRVQIGPLDFSLDPMKHPYGELADISPDTLRTLARARLAARSTLEAKGGRPAV